MKTMSNERLCAFAQQGDIKAQNLLIENNLPYVKKTAYELWNAHAELNRSLGIIQEDLIPEGSIGLYHCIKSYQPDSENKFLTYASPAIYNAMLDYIRRQNQSFESRFLNEIVRNPEQIYLEKEQHEVLYCFTISTINPDIVSVFLKSFQNAKVLLLLHFPYLPGI